MSSSNKKLVLKKLKEHNTIWHPESTVVFKSQSERLVIGRYVDGELIPLDETALELCEEWKFKPDESLIEADGEEEENNGEDEEDNGEEQEAADEEAADEEAAGEEREGEEEAEEDTNKDEPEPIKEPPKKKEVKESTSKKSSKITPSQEVVYGDISGDVAHLLQKVLFVNLENVHELFGQVLDEKYEKTLKDMSSEYEGKLEVLREELITTKGELDKVTKDYNGIKQKFDAMKSLFN